ncbi:MAG: ATP-binding protein [Bdellovibrionales bacterium]
MKSKAYRIAMWGVGRISSLKPTGPLDSAQNQILPNIYETLFYKNAAGNFSSHFVLRTEWKPDQNLYVLHLKNKYFHNGQKVDAHDIVYSLERGFAESLRVSNNSWEAHNVEWDNVSIKTSGDQTVLIYLQGVSRMSFLREISNLSFAIRPRGSDACSDIIGTGPYKLESRTGDFSKVVLQKFRKYESSHKAFEKLIFKAYATKSKREKAFLEHKIDEITHFGQIGSLPPNLLKYATRNSYQFLSLLQFNTRSEVFGDYERRNWFYKVAHFCGQHMPLNNRFLPTTGLIPSGYLGHRQKPFMQSMDIKLNSSLKDVAIRVGVTSERQKRDILSIFTADLLDQFQLNLQFVKIPSFANRKEYLESNEVDVILTYLKVENDNCRNVVSIFDRNHPHHFMAIEDPEINRWLQSIEKSKDRNVELDKFKKIEELALSKRYCVPLAYLQTYQCRSESVLIDLENWEQTGQYYEIQKADASKVYERHQAKMLELKNQVSELKSFKRAYSVVEQLNHDMGSPLSAVKLVASQIDDRPQLQSLLHAAVGKLQGMMNEFRIEAERIRSFKEYTSYLSANSALPIESPEVKDVIHASEFIAKEVGNSLFEHIDKGDVVLNMDVPPFLRDQISINKSLLQRVISNLLNNSIQAKQKGPVRINFDFFNEESHLVVELSDNGVGICNESIMKVFDYGYSSAEKNSTGLGLYHAKQFMESVHGSISIQSVLGQGTTIQLRFPIAGASTLTTKNI